MEILRHLPFRHQITKVAGLLGVRSTLRRVYRWCFAPGGGEHTLSVAGETARFYVYSEANIEALRSLGGERPTLEFLIGNCGLVIAFTTLGLLQDFTLSFLLRRLEREGKSWLSSLRIIPTSACASTLT